MICLDCDKSDVCEYKIEEKTSPQGFDKDKTVAHAGADCPLNWHGIAVKDMTVGQLREAVKDLRITVLNLKFMHKINTKENMNEPLYKEPLLDCKPSWISSGERIKELSEAITRNIGGTHKDTDSVKKWAAEILYHCEIMEKC